MKQITLYDILNTEPFKFTLREIEEMMDEELSKDPDEMDTELIDICADVINRAHAEEDKRIEQEEMMKAKKIKARKVFLIAAVLAFALSLSLSASAKFLNIDASEKVVQFINNHFNINLGNANTETDDYTDNGLELINSLNEKGFENIVLPAALISEDYATKINTFSGEIVEQILVYFNSNSSDISGTINITKYTSDNDSLSIGQGSVPGSYNQVKQIFVSGIDVLIFNDSTDTIIYYIDKNIEYHISINCDFDSAVEIAETIK